MDDRLRRCPATRPAIALRSTELLRLRWRLQAVLRVVHVLRGERAAGVLRAVDAVRALLRRPLQQRLLQELHPEARAIRERALHGLRHVACALHEVRVEHVLRVEDAVRVLRGQLQLPEFLRAARELRVVRVLPAVPALRVACALHRDGHCDCGFAGDHCGALHCAQDVLELPASQPRSEQQALLWRRTGLPAT